MRLRVACRRRQPQTHRRRRQLAQARTGGRAIATGLSRPVSLRAIGLTWRAARAILNHMVRFQPAKLDRTFSALADATRRAILVRLSEAPELTISELAKPFPVS